MLQRSAFFAGLGGGLALGGGFVTILMILLPFRFGLADGWPAAMFTDVVFYAFAVTALVFLTVTVVGICLCQRAWRLYRTAQTSRASDRSI